MASPSSSKVTLRGLLSKVLVSLLGVVGLMVIALHDRLGSQFDDKVYPVLLVASIALWHWLVWRLFYELIGLPEEYRLTLNKWRLTQKRAYRLPVSVGYLLVALSVFGFYVEPHAASSGRGIRFALIAISLGLFVQMLAAVRHLISEKFPGQMQ